MKLFRNPTLIAALVTLAGATLSYGQIVSDGSFETPNLGSGNYSYRPTGATWSFAGNSGIINAPNGAFAGPAAPDGSQYAFLQSGFTGAGPTQFSETINLAVAGVYEISFMAAGRSNAGGGNMAYEVLLDAAVIATDATTTSQAFASKVFDFTALGGSHTLTFQALTTGGDSTALVDSVSIVSLAAPTAVPESGSTVAMLALGVVGLIGCRGKLRPS